MTTLDTAIFISFALAIAATCLSVALFLIKLIKKNNKIGLPLASLGIGIVFLLITWMLYMHALSTELTF